MPIFPGKIGRSGPYWACAFLNVVDPEVRFVLYSSIRVNRALRRFSCVHILL